jgi:hypothetical protein
MPRVIQGVEFPDDATPQEVAEFLMAEGIELPGGPEADEPIEADPLLSPDLLLGGPAAIKGVLGLGSAAMRVGRAAPGAVRGAGAMLGKVAGSPNARGMALDVLPEFLPSALRLPIRAAQAAARIGKAAGGKAPVKGSAASRVKPAAKVAGKIGPPKTKPTRPPKKKAAPTGSAASRTRPSQAMRGASGPELQRRQAAMEAATSRPMPEGTDLAAALEQSLSFEQALAGLSPAQRSIMRRLAPRIGPEAALDALAQLQGGMIP